MRLGLLITVLSFAVVPLFAQERCGTVPYMQKLFEKFGIKETPEQFENWLEEKARLQTQSAFENGRTATTLQIPVVVHVIHSGQAYGVGANIPDERIFSQIDVLNADFTRTNADNVNTPAAFVAVAGAMDIEFVLAKSTPEGLPTNGIVRVNGGQATWQVDSDPTLANLKEVSYWPSEDYLNIWVANLASPYLGIAQYPVSNLSGLEPFQDGLAETDGVVIDFSVFGVGAPDAQYNLGRTTTHEVGHFLGLRHIWGDDDNRTDKCSLSDFVTDTPNQSIATYGGKGTSTCTLGVVTDNCSPSAPGIMYQNFMDYTDDVCMNIFTAGQVSRMNTVMQNSPRRVSLPNSPGLVPPSGLGEDLKINQVISPSVVSCFNYNDLKFTISNLGSPTITSFKVNYKINSESVVTTNFNGVAIPSGGTYDITLPVSLSNGENEIYLQAHTPNGVADSSPDNSDTLFHVLINKKDDVIPLREAFEGANNWSTLNPHGGFLWQTRTTNFYKSYYFNSFNNTNENDESWLISPVLNFSGTNRASLFFDYAYGYNPAYEDQLKIIASVNCGTTFDYTLLDLSGEGLATYDPLISSEWLPSDESDWKTRHFVNLNNLAGENGVIIAFVATRGAVGNNIFIDNIEFFTNDDPTPYNTGNDLYHIYRVERGNADITFDLPNRQSVGLSVTDSQGRQLYSEIIPNVLNQTFRVPVGYASDGLYLVRVQVGSRYYLTKVYIAP